MEIAGLKVMFAAGPGARLPVEYPIEILKFCADSERAGGLMPQTGATLMLNAYDWRAYSVIGIVDRQRSGFVRIALDGPRRSGKYHLRRFAATMPRTVIDLDVISPDRAAGAGRSKNPT